MSGKPETSGKPEKKSPSPPKIVRASPGEIVKAGLTGQSKTKLNNAPRSASPNKVKTLTKDKNRKNRKMRKTLRK